MRCCKAFFIEAATTLFELFYPSHCAGCGVALSGKSKLCDHCWNKLERLLEPFCPTCSHALNHSSISFCENCGDRKLHFVAGVSAFRHQGLVRQLLSQLKYASDQSLKKVMGELIEISIKDKRLQNVNFEAIVPVPLHLLREREREFNQAWLLAKEVALRLKTPMRDILSRTKSTSTQVCSDRKERIKNLQGAFVLKKQQELSGNYLLVDDVLTTGSTLDECAKVLLNAGAEAVWAVTVARS